MESHGDKEAIGAKHGGDLHFGRGVRANNVTFGPYYDGEIAMIVR